MVAESVTALNTFVIRAMSWISTDTVLGPERYRDKFQDRYEFNISLISVLVGVK